MNLLLFSFLAGLATIYAKPNLHHNNVKRGDDVKTPEAALYPGKRQTDAPNIIFIVADDHGSADISWHDDSILTPNLQALADEGVVIENNYVQPACTPSRAALMTGKYPFRYGLQHIVFLEGSPACVPLSEQFLPEALKDLGYSTHMIGKWHLGMCETACTPPKRGFDTFYGYLNGMLEHFHHYVSGGYDWQDAGKADTSNNGTYATDLINDRTIQIIKDHDSADGPLFIYMSHAATHQPFQARDDEIRARYPDVTDHERSHYLGLLSALDDSVGEVVQALKDSGLYDNSVIVFTSDNGGEIGPASNAPLRGFKASSFEGGTRVAGMFHSPLMTKKGYKHEGDFHVTDWFPTLVDMAGGSTTGLDGVVQTDMLMNGGDTARDEIIYNIDKLVPALYGKASIKNKDGYKLMWGFGGLYDGWEADGNTGLTNEVNILGVDYKRKREYSFDLVSLGQYAQAVDDTLQLFNLKDDPEERKEISADNPDIVATLKARLQDLLDQAAPVDMAHISPAVEANPNNYGGIWTPDWGVECGGT